MRTRKQALLLDLGTLLDTAPDMANALNVLLVEEQRTPLSFAQIGPVVSHGGTGLIRLAFGVTEEPQQLHSWLSDSLQET